MRVDLVLQCQIFGLLLPQASDLLTVQTIYDFPEERKDLAGAAPVCAEDGIYIAVSAIAAECPAQFPLCCQPHKRHLPVKLFVFGRTDARRFLEQSRKIFQITVADLISDVLHRVFITA